MKSREKMSARRWRLLLRRGVRSAGGPGDEGKGRRYKIARVLESLLRLLLQNSPREGRVGVAETKVFIVSRYKRERGEQLRVSSVPQVFTSDPLRPRCRARAQLCSSPEGYAQRHTKSSCWLTRNCYEPHCWLGKHLNDVRVGLGTRSSATDATGVHPCTTLVLK